MSAGWNQPEGDAERRFRIVAFHALQALLEKGTARSREDFALTGYRPGTDGKRRKVRMEQRRLLDGFVASSPGGLLRPPPVWSSSPLDFELPEDTNHNLCSGHRKYRGLDCPAGLDPQEVLRIWDDLAWQLALLWGTDEVVLPRSDAPSPERVAEALDGFRVLGEQVVWRLGFPGGDPYGRLRLAAGADASFPKAGMDCVSCDPSLCLDPPGAEWLLHVRLPRSTCWAARVLCGLSGSGPRPGGPLAADLWVAGSKEFPKGGEVRAVREVFRAAREALEVAGSAGGLGRRRRVRCDDIDGEDPAQPINPKLEGLLLHDPLAEPEPAEDGVRALSAEEEADRARIRQDRVRARVRSLPRAAQDGAPVPTATLELYGLGPVDRALGVKMGLLVAGRLEEEYAVLGAKVALVPPAIPPRDASPGSADAATPGSAGDPGEGARQQGAHAGIELRQEDPADASPSLSQAPTPPLVPCRGAKRPDDLGLGRPLAGLGVAAAVRPGSGPAVEPPPSEAVRPASGSPAEPPPPVAVPAGDAPGLVAQPGQAPDPAVGRN